MSVKKDDLKDIRKSSQCNEKETKQGVKETLSKREAVFQKYENIPTESAKTHIVAEGETLSHIALKYYGKATPPYYQHIYETNRDVIGDNLNSIVPGQKLIIPKLPDELL